MNIRDMKYLVAVADLKSFSKAADKCFVSQPTLSGQIKKLEEWLGVAIFERNNKKVMVTEVGQEIIISARKIISEAQNIQEIANNASDPLSGKFHLGAFPTLASYIFPNIVPKIKEKMPDLRLILHERKTDELIIELANGKIDAALLALPYEHKTTTTNFSHTELFNDQFKLAVAKNHELAGRKNITNDELQNFQLMLLNEGHCMREQALELCSMSGIGAEQDFSATSLETLRQMVKAGTGITLIPNIAIYPDDNDIVYIPFAKPAPYRIIGLVWRTTTIKREIINNIEEIAIKFYRSS